MGTSQIQGNTIPQIISNNQTPQLRGFLFNISSINFHGKLYSIKKQDPYEKYFKVSSDSSFCFL